MTDAQKEQCNVKRKLEQRLHWQRKKELEIISTCVVTSPSNLKHLKGRLHNTFPKCHLKFQEDKRQMLKN